MLKELKRATGVSFDMKLEPAYRIVNRAGFNQICELSLNGDPRFPTIESVQNEGLRLGILEKTEE